MNIQKILNRTFCRDFVEKMKNRLLVSYCKYGDLKKTKQNIFIQRDELKNAKYRIGLYEKTGNTEYLVDAANFIMFEYMEMKGYFKAEDGDLKSKIV